MNICTEKMFETYLQIADFGPHDMWGKSSISTLSYVLSIIPAMCEGGRVSMNAVFWGHLI